MKNEKKIKKLVISSYQSRVLALINQVESGVPYHDLGGVKLTVNRQLIRLKVGIYRILFKEIGNELLFVSVIKRKDLEKKIKRR